MSPASPVVDIYESGELWEGSGASDGVHEDKSLANGSMIGYTWRNRRKRTVRELCNILTKH